MSANSYVTETGKGLSRHLGLSQEDLIKILNHWWHHSPPEYREDMVQGIALAWCERKVPSVQKASFVAKELASQIWHTWHRKGHYGEHLISIDGLTGDIQDGDGHAILEVLVAAVEFETLVVSNIHALEVYKRWPQYVRDIVAKRIRGDKSNKHDSLLLQHWAATNPTQWQPLMG